MKTAKTVINNKITYRTETKSGASANSAAGAKNILSTGVCTPTLNYCILPHNNCCCQEFLPKTFRLNKQKQPPFEDSGGCFYIFKF